MNEAGPVFIVGGSRTGSEMLKTMLSASPALDFVDELFLYCPRWLHQDLDSTLQRSMGDQWRNPERLTELLDVLYSGKPYGWFWRNAHEQLDRQQLEDELSGKKIDMQSLFDAIMTVHAEMRGKRGSGAKFPMHYSETDRLLNWYPNCKIIHTTRNPKAVYASQAAKYLQPQHGSLTRGFRRFQQFVHINIQTTWTARIHRSMRDLPNYLLVRYEDVVTDTRPQLEKICEFLDIQYQPAMLEPHQYGSSFESIGDASGVDQSSLEKWQSTISPLTARIFDWMHPGANVLLGYAGRNDHRNRAGRSA